MILEKKTSLATRCSGCGRLEINQINIFQLSGQKELTYSCQCGRGKIDVVRDRGEVHLTAYCLVCDRRHDLVVSDSRFWNIHNVSNLTCPRTGLNLGYYGGYALLQQEVDRQQKELEMLADGLGFDDFADPEIMLMALDILHDFAAGGDLICECGSSEVSIDLFSDFIQLTCQRCQGFLSLPAGDQEDVGRLRERETLLLTYQSNTSPPRSRN